MKPSERNVVRQTPVSESVSMPASRERQSTPVATRPADVSRVEPTSTMVFRSHTREGRSSAEKPEMHARPGSSSTTGSRNPGGNSRSVTCNEWLWVR